MASLGPTRPPEPQEPPGFKLPGAASLLEQLDKRILIVLRDGRHLVGVMRSFDQFSNMILEDTCERHIRNGMKSDIPLGLYLVRGDSVVLLGEVDPVREAAQGLEDVDIDKLEEAASGQEAEDKTWDFDKLDL